MPEPRVIVVGAGPAGLALALSLARLGRPVTVVERDPAQPIDDPRSAFESWSRPGVAHHRLPHSLLGRTRRALRENAPDVLQAMLDAGAWENDLGKRLVREAARLGDEDLVAVHCRRPFFECVLRRAAAAEPLVDIVSDAEVDGLVLHRSGQSAQRVKGVRIRANSLDADVVVDAGGRRSPIRRLLDEAGVSVPNGQIEPCGVIYYCRYYRLLEGVDYPVWTGALGPSGTTDTVRFSVFFGDNQTFAIVLGVPASVHGLRGLARDHAFTSAVSRFRTLAPFIESSVSEPITGVVAMGALQNTYHPPLNDGRPVVLGLHFIGDAYCHTNPLFAWGLCLGLDYGFTLARIINEYPTDVEAQAFALAEASQVEVDQCFRAVAEEDHDRTLTWDGAPPFGPWLGRTFAGFVRQCALPTIGLDPTVARAVLRRAQLLDLPEALIKDDAVIHRIIALQAEVPVPPADAFPSRDELLELATTGDGGGS